MAEQAKVPAIRFAGFTDPWEQRKFVDFVEASGIRNKDNLQLESYSVSNDRGFVPQDEQFENGGTMRDADKTAYWIVEPGSFAYNPARINVGSIGYQSTRKNVIVSSLYEVFKTDRSCDDRFLWHWFKSSLFTKQIEMLQEGGVRLYFFFDKLQKSEIWMPNVDEQRIIGQQFDQLDSLITLHQRKYDKLVVFKKSMLEKMFPKDGESVPEIRFAGFTDPWEQRKLGELMDVASVRRVHQEDWTDEGVRFLRARDLVAFAKNESIEDPLFISSEMYKEYSAQSGKVSVGDLLVTGVGTIGVPWLVTSDNPVYFKDGNIIWFKNRHSIDGGFFYHSFTASAIQNCINEAAGIGTVGTYTIETGKKTPIWLPSRQEQREIAAMMTHLDTLITLHQRKLELLQNIKKSLLDKMFV